VSGSPLDSKETTEKLVKLMEVALIAALGLLLLLAALLMDVGPFLCIVMLLLLALLVVGYFSFSAMVLLMGSQLMDSAKWDADTALNCGTPTIGWDIGCYALIVVCGGSLGAFFIACCPVVPLCAACRECRPGGGGGGGGDGDEENPGCGPCGKGPLAPVCGCLNKGIRCTISCASKTVDKAFDCSKCVCKCAWKATAPLWCCCCRLVEKCAGDKIIPRPCAFKLGVCLGFVSFVLCCFCLYLPVATYSPALPGFDPTAGEFSPGNVTWSPEVPSGGAPWAVVSCPDPDQWLTLTVWGVCTHLGAARGGGLICIDYTEWGSGFPLDSKAAFSEIGGLVYSLLAVGAGLFLVLLRVARLKKGSPVVAYVVVVGAAALLCAFFAMGMLVVFHAAKASMLAEWASAAFWSVPAAEQQLLPRLGGGGTLRAPWFDLDSCRARPGDVSFHLGTGAYAAWGALILCGLLALIIFWPLILTVLCGLKCCFAICCGRKGKSEDSEDPTSDNRGLQTKTHVII
jgi:hypothetical protein